MSDPMKIWLNVDPKAEHAMASNGPMGVMGCTCGWWGSVEDAEMHALAVEDEGGECLVDWQECTFDLVTNDLLRGPVTP